MWNREDIGRVVQHFEHYLVMYIKDKDEIDIFKYEDEKVKFIISFVSIDKFYDYILPIKNFTSEIQLIENFFEDHNPSKITSDINNFNKTFGRYYYDDKKSCCYCFRYLKTIQN